MHLRQAIGLYDACADTATHLRSLLRARGEDPNTSQTEQELLRNRRIVILQQMRALRSDDEAAVRAALDEWSAEITNHRGQVTREIDMTQPFDARPFQVPDLELEEQFKRYVVSEYLLPQPGEGGDRRALLVCGQVGAGKSRSVESHTRGGDYARVDVEELREYYPSYDLLMLQTPKDIPEGTAQASEHLLGMSLEWFWLQGRPVAWEATFRSMEAAVKALRAFHDTGYSVEVVCLAVPRAASLLSTVERYLAEVSRSGIATSVRVDVHDATYDLALAVMRQLIEEFPDISVVVRDRHDRTLFPSSEYATAEAALAGGRRLSEPVIRELTLEVERTARLLARFDITDDPNPRQCLDAVLHQLQGGPEAVGPLGHALDVNQTTFAAHDRREREGYGRDESQGDAAPPGEGEIEVIFDDDDFAEAIVSRAQTDPAYLEQAIAVVTRWVVGGGQPVAPGASITLDPLLSVEGTSALLEELLRIRKMGEAL